MRLQRLDMLIGATTCALLAALAALLFRHFAFRATLPLAFIPVLMIASQRFGAGAGVLGGIAAAAIFGHFYAYAAALQNNLAWMLLLGIPACYFVASPVRSFMSTREQSSFR